jgi:hypothetical protein
VLQGVSEVRLLLILPNLSPTPFGQNQMPCGQRRSSSAEGVGVWLADDLLRSSSKIRHPGRIRQTQSPGDAAAARQIADKVERHPGWLPRPSARIKSHAANAALLLPKA